MTEKKIGPVETAMRSLVANYSPLPQAVKDAAIADCEARRQDAVAGLSVIKDAAVKVDEGSA
jgi:hypothetical protein